MTIEWTKLDSARKGALHQIEVASHQGRLNGLHVHLEAQDYPQISVRGKRRRGPWNPKYNGEGLRAIRARHGVGRPVVSDVSV